MAQLNAGGMNPPRIGITQRHLTAGDNSFARDALDAAWSDWFGEVLPGASFVAIPNFGDARASIRYLESWGINALVLSGGEDIGSSPRRDAVETTLLSTTWRKVSSRVVMIVKK